MCTAPRARERETSEPERFLCKQVPLQRRRTESHLQLKDARVPPLAVVLKSGAAARLSTWLHRRYTGCAIGVYSFGTARRQWSSGGGRNEDATLEGLSLSLARVDAIFTPDETRLVSFDEAPNEQQQRGERSLRCSDRLLPLSISVSLVPVSRPVSREKETRDTALRGVGSSVARRRLRVLVQGSTWTSGRGWSFRCVFGC